MVGEGVMYECLNHPDISEILVIGRKSCGYTHSKIKELLVDDFFELSKIENEMIGYDACFFCLGVTSVGKKEPEYYHLTYELTLNFANTLCRLNQQMTFCYISGAGTDSTEKGKSMWARVKGKTENDLMKLPFNQVYNFRPGIISPTRGLKNTHKAYKFLFFLIPVFNAITPKYISSLKQLGQAMIKSLTLGYEKQILEVNDIKILAAK